MYHLRSSDHLHTAPTGSVVLEPHLGSPDHFCSLRIAESGGSKTGVQRPFQGNYGRVIGLQHSSTVWLGAWSQGEVTLSYGQGGGVRRIHLFEFVDLPWYPETFRRIQTDYLQFVATRGSGHKNLIPLIGKALQQAHTTEIVDLCSGGTGPWLNLQQQLAQAGWPVSIKLTDRYPHPEAAQRWAAASDRPIEYLAEAVDAMRVPPHLTGMRTLFEGFHHFKPQQGQAILQDAVEQRVAIGIFEATLKPPLGPFMLLLAPLMTLLGYFIMTPFIKPRAWTRFLWTYLIPIVPLTTCWDGVVSHLRVYSPQELRDLTALIPSQGYAWEAGLASTGTPLFSFTYLLGYPV
jgi:hypothetical protein